MDYEVPFDSIESAQEFVNMLAQVVLETRHDLEGDMQKEIVPSRRLEALQLTAYKMQTLEFHLKKSRCILNDLRSLRRLLLGKLSDRVPERRPKPVTMTKSIPLPINPSAKPKRSEQDLALLGLTG